MVVTLELWIISTMDAIPRGLIWDTNMAVVSLFWDTNMAAVSSCKNTQFPHSINYEETGTSEGLWDRLGRRKTTNMSFFDVFNAPSFALVNSASQSNATSFENIEK